MAREAAASLGRLRAGLPAVVPDHSMYWPWVFLNSSMWTQASPKQRRSVKLHVRLRAPGNGSRGRVERHLPETVQRQFMRLVERQVHHPCEPTLDPQLAAAETAHQIADDRVLAQRDQRTEVAIPPRHQRLVAQSVIDLLHHVRRLLVRRLCARGHLRPFLAEPG